jgi:hypothetical protein
MIIHKHKLQKLAVSTAALPPQQPPNSPSKPPIFQKPTPAIQLKLHNNGISHDKSSILSAILNSRRSLSSVTEPPIPAPPTTKRHIRIRMRAALMDPFPPGHERGCFHASRYPEETDQQNSIQRLAIAVARPLVRDQFPFPHTAQVSISLGRAAFLCTGILCTGIYWSDYGGGIDPRS